MGRSPGYLSVAQFDLLTWVSGGCPAGVYEGSSYRVSARALHNRGLVRVRGSGRSWTAAITAEGARLLKEQARRIAAEREQERREEQARADRVREQRQLRARAVQVLESVMQGGGRLDLGTEISKREIGQIKACLAEEGLLPQGQRLAYEPLRMDPDLGVSVYLEPDFEALTPLRAFTVPRQLRSPHPCVTEFQERRQYVSRPQIPRAARYLQALVLAADQMGWAVPPKTPTGYGGRGEASPDLLIRLPSGEVTVTIRELDQRGRPGLAFVTRADYYTRSERTTAVKSFTASGRLEVTVAKGWGGQLILAQRDTSKATLEEQVPVLVRALETGEAEAQWARTEEERRAGIREARWGEVRKEAVTKVAYDRNAQRLHDELARRDAAAAMIAYADEITAHAAEPGTSDAAAALEWASWIRQHAERTSPLNGPLHVLEVTTFSHDELQPHMNGWSTRGPFRH